MRKLAVTVALAVALAIGVTVPTGDGGASVGACGMYWHAGDSALARIPVAIREACNAG